MVAGMLCSCFLPTCNICYGPSRVAGPSASRARPGCWRLLPGCVSCSAPQQPTGRLSSKGRTVTPEMAAVIASVDDRLRAMLEGHAESKAHLQIGAAFLDLPSSHDCFLELRAMIIWWLTCATLAFVQFRVPVSGLLRHTSAASFFQQRASSVVGMGSVGW